MYDVGYRRAGSIQEALQLLRGGGEAKLISGGQTLIPTMKMRLAAPSDLIDLRHVADFDVIETSGDRLTIGAGATHAVVADSVHVKQFCSALCSLAGGIGDPHIRHMGTIGGSLANNDPAADYPASVLALNATVVTTSRELAAHDFFTGLFETALAEDEILTAVRFKAPERAAYEKIRNTASRYALAGVFVALVEGKVRVAVTGAGNEGVFRWREAEDALAANFSPDALNGIKPAERGMLSDVHASAAYRANLVSVLGRRAVFRCHDEEPSPRSSA